MTSRAKKAKAARPVAIPSKKKSRLSFFPEAIGELRKARWPTRQEATRLSIMVFVVCTFVGAVLAAIDYGFSKVLYLVLGG